MDAAQHGWTPRLVALTTSFRQVGFGRLGAFVLPVERDEPLHALGAALGAEELVYLATCNRVELYALLPEGVEAERARRAAVRYFEAQGASGAADAFTLRCGREALSHLFRVTSSLDSLLLGETEISGQVRRALERARRAGVCGPTLGGVFERALACSRRVRAETEVGRTFVSVATLALQKVRRHFGADGPGVTVLVGVGDMCRKVAQALADRGGERIVVNRTLAKAEAFCARYGGRPMALDAFLADPPARIDLVFAATAADRPVVTLAALRPALDARLAAGGPPLIVVDLGMPRDVERAVDAHPAARVVAMDHLEALSRRNQDRLDGEAARAEAIAREEVERVLREDRFRALAGASADALLEGRLGHLAAADREAILRFVTGLAGRLARQPLELAEEPPASPALRRVG